MSNHPDLAKKYGYEEAEGGASAAEAGAAEGNEKKGGGGKKKGGLKEVTIAQKSRQKNKFICLVRGLEKFGASPALSWFDQCTALLCTRNTSHRARLAW